ncbi:MAG: peptidoglycan DD-metalloendopeptidase family protein [Deltaproteobacteria bacterium]|nr:peptidoglycan DD-metalloendopeptidase family protein [Deltaproteobacteria bacterium]
MPVLFAMFAAALAATLPADSSEPNALPNLCAEWQALEKRIRDGRMAPADAERKVADLHSRLVAAFGGTVPAAPLVFPLKGLDARYVGGRGGEGYCASRYDFYNPGHRSGHPALDIFMDDDNGDTIDDKTGQKVEVISSNAGVVTALNTEWNKTSEDRGGKYVWVFSPAHARYCYYAHLDSIAVKLGDVVEAGTTLGLLGRTGKNARMRRSPTHLHQMCLVFERGRLRPKNMYRDLTLAYVVQRDADRNDYRFARGAFERRVRDIPAPEGFKRTDEPGNSFGAWLRNLPLPLDFDTGKRSGSRGVGSILKLRAEFLHARRASSRIRFEVAPGLPATYAEWLEGYRLRVTENTVEWMAKAAAPVPADYRYSNFRQYVDSIAPRAASALPAAQADRVPPGSGILAGDLFFNGAAPGSAAIVVDSTTDAAGKRKVLLAGSAAGSGGPRILYNAEKQSPWFDADALATVTTPGWTFTANDLMRFRD